MKRKIVARRKLLKWYHALIGFLVIVSVVAFFKALDVKVGGVFSVYSNEILIVSGVLIIILISIGAFSLTKTFKKAKGRYLN